MILKLKTDGIGWIIISDIKSISYNTFDEIDKSTYDNVIEGNSANKLPWRVIYAYPPSSAEIKIATQLSAFLMNDNGKTIETIY